MKLFNNISSILLILLASLCGCSDTPKYRIGVSQCSDDDWRKKINGEITREMLFHDNVEVEFLSADDNSLKQMEDLRYFASNGFDLIITAPNESDILTPLLDSIYTAGIPLVIFDRKTNSDNYTSFQGADNMKIGQAAAQYANAVFQPIHKSLNVLEIEGNMETSPARERHAGFNQYADSCQNFQVIAAADAQWTTEGARRVTDSLLKIYPQTNVIFAHNDRMAIGSAMVTDSLGRGDIKIIGIDASPSIGLKAVMDSVIDVTFIYPSEGRNLLKTAIDILEGKPYQKNITIPTRTPVDLTNAEILLLQQQALEVETNNILDLKGRLDYYWEQHSIQSIMLYGTILIAVLLGILVFIILRNSHIQRQLRNEAEVQNQKLVQQQEHLMRQHEEIESQNQQLVQKNEEISQILDQLQQATQSKLTFFTNVSHDLRTPLTLIAEPVAQMVAADNLTPRQSKLMDLAWKNLKILMRLINEILDFRKYENGKLNLNLQCVNLVSQVRDWTEAFHEAATRKHLRFKVTLPEATPDYDIDIDVDKIERILFNLLSNAFKFTPENGTVKVELYRQGNNLCLSVTDNGKGISQADLPQVFDRFFKSEKVNPHGSGIGLALSKAFAELHGGNITVESVQGKGARFILTLPVNHPCGSALKTDSENLGADASNQVIGNTSDNTITDVPNNTTNSFSTNNKSTRSSDLADPDSHLQGQFGDISTWASNTRDKEPCATGPEQIFPTDEETQQNATTVLVIDDNPDIRSLIQNLIQDEYTVLEAADGTDGIKLATKYIPDLIICDIMMPGIDGLETCKRIKNEETTSHIPIMMLTACAMDAQRIQGYECGADAYLTKPFNSEVLMARCRSLISNRKRLKDIYSVATHTGQADENTTMAGADLDNDFYKKFVDIVNSEMGNPNLNVDEIADRLNISRVQLYRKLKALTNYSPTDLLKNMRLRRAAQLLKTTTSTVSQIGYAVGFASHSYFTKCYREYFGESPSEAQKRTSKPK